jgi:hypothetical protein
MGSEGGGTRALPVAEEWERETLNTGGGRAEEMKLWPGVPKMGGKASIYRGRWNKRSTICLDPRTYRVPSSCLSE